MTISVTAKSRTLSNGTANDAIPVESNFTELYNNDSTLATGVNGILGTTSTTSAVDGKYLILRNSFSGSPASSDYGGLRMYRGASSAREFRWNETLGAWDITHDGTNYFPVSLVTTADPSSPANGFMWYNTTSNQFKAYINGATETLLTQSASPYPKGFIGGLPVTYTSSSSVTVPSGLSARDDSNAANMDVSSNLVISFANANGALGLDTGTKTNSTWYYVWLCKGSSGITALFSASSTSPTLPTGYTSYKRRLNMAIRVDGSGNILPFAISAGWPYLSQMMYRDFEMPQDGSGNATGNYIKLSGGTATSFTAQSLATLVPPISKMAYLQGSVVFVSNNVSGFIRPTGSGLTTGIHVGVGDSGMSSPSLGGTHGIWTPTDASQSIDYYVVSTASKMYLWVQGFTVTEVL